jgi:predicted metal-binding membrane protein
VRAGRPQMFGVLDDAGLLSEKMALGNTTLASTELIAAGVYQWTPLNTCLTHCRSPTEFMIRHWDPRSFGAVRTGLRNGLFFRLPLDAEGRFCSSAD